LKCYEQTFEQERYFVVANLSGKNPLRKIEQNLGSEMYIIPVGHQNAIVQQQTLTELLYDRKLRIVICHVYIQLACVITEWSQLEMTYTML